jgi:hypothetical protein
MKLNEFSSSEKRGNGLLTVWKIFERTLWILYYMKLNESSSSEKRGIGLLTVWKIYQADMKAFTI